MKFTAQVSLFSLIAASSLFLSACGQAPVHIVQPQFARPQVVQPMQPTLQRRLPLRPQQRPLYRGYGESLEASTPEFLVRFAPDASRHALAQFAQKYQLKISGYLQQLNVYVYTSHTPMTQQDLARFEHTLNADSAVEYAEINHQVQIDPILN